MAAHNDLGKWGEDVAEEYLQGLGYSIVERDWHSGHRDIDLIAIDDRFLVFVEVKTRRSRSFLDPIQSVNYRKLANLRAAINHYLKSHHHNLEARFDVITVVGQMGQQPNITHIKDFRIM